MTVFSQILSVILSEMKEEIKVSWFVSLDLPEIRNIPSKFIHSALLFL